MLSRAKALLVCACGRERQHPSSPHGSGFPWALGGSWGQMWCPAPSPCRDCSEGLGAAFSLCLASHHVPPLGWLQQLCCSWQFRAIPHLACSVASENGPSLVGSGHPSPSSQPIYQPGHCKRLWMKVLLCGRPQRVYWIPKFPHVPPILF